MKYYRAQQFVPNKGVAELYYEVEEPDTVKRFMTVFPEIDEIELMPEPPMKRLFRPELLEPVDPETFQQLWDRG